MSSLKICSIVVSFHGTAGTDRCFRRFPRERASLRKLEYVSMTERIQIAIDPKRRVKKASSRICCRGVRYLAYEENGESEMKIEDKKR